ncbi:unnamed protein product, partial [Rotaria sp. Silwood2]
MMCDKIPATLLTIPVDIVYRILGKLSDLTIIISVRNVCERLDIITDAYHRYQ